MRRIVMILLLTCACYTVQAQVNYITTIAGKAGVPASDSGDGGLATYARFFAPESVCLDKEGNIYIADAENNKIREINFSTGIITTIAGIDTFGYNGDGEQATNAELFLPEFIRMDSPGNIYFSDGGNERIRKITASTGIITTIAGNGIYGYAGDNGPAINAEFNLPAGLCLDKYGNIYVADYSNNVVRKINASTGIITTFAGNGGFAYTGDGMPATDATFNGPLGLCADNFGNIYISDLYNHAVRKVDAATGVITTIAGTGTLGHTGDSGLAIHAQLNQPAGLLIDGQNNIFIAEFGDGIARRIDGVTGIITTVAGDGTWGWAGDGSPATAAELSCTDLAIDSYGCMIIVDHGTNTIRKVYNPKLGVNNVQMSQYANVQIYPNPAKDNFTIEGANGSEILIYDILGKKILQTFISSNKETVNIESLTSGFYTIQTINENGEKKVLKLIKE